MIFFLLSCNLAVQASVDPELLRRTWPARWISHPEAGRDPGVYHFRLKFSLERAPEAFRIHVSADNRYELFLNGERVVMGPARGDLLHWRFETIDLAPWLSPGDHVLAAVVWNLGDLAPMAQISHRTAFVVQGGGEATALVDTPGDWRCVENPAWEFLEPYRDFAVQGYYVAGPGMQFDGARHLWNWNDRDFDDRSWVEPVAISPASPRGARDSHAPWWFVPNPLPQMESKIEHFARAFREPGSTAPESLIDGRFYLEVAPKQEVQVVLDRGQLTNAYPELTVSGGAGSRIELVYAEAPYLPEESFPPRRWRKGNRNEVAGKWIVGVTDVFLPDGGDNRIFRPLWWRTYRYVQISIRTTSEPLTVEAFTGRFTGYPFQEVAEFDSDRPELQEIWEVGWRTLRLCAHESFMDCPYYEQLQYAGDTRIQALIALYVSGDDRLVRNAIEHLAASQMPEGLTLSRHPAALPQVIPPFSLFWIEMIRDLWMLREDPAFFRSHLPGIRRVVSWFQHRMGEDYLLGPLPWWNFVDWADEFRGGDGPGAADGRSSILSLQYASALRSAADLEDAFGTAFLAREYRQTADRIVRAVRDCCWAADRLLFADTPQQDSFSQHASILAVLQEAIQPEESALLMERILQDDTLIQTTFYFRFYLGRALKKAGLGDRYLEMLDPWRTMLDLGLTTWAEKPEPTRSDCHAWSSSPNYELLATVAGVEPAEPGFRSVRIRPHPGPLSNIRAAVAHPDGLIRVDLRRMDERLVGRVQLPDGVSGIFVYGEQQVQLNGGRNLIE